MLGLGVGVNQDTVAIEYAPGQLFSWGSHDIVYIARDDAENSALCSFRVHVLSKWAARVQIPPRGSFYRVHVLSKRVARVQIPPRGSFYRVHVLSKWAAWVQIPPRGSFYRVHVLSKWAAWVQIPPRPVRPSVSVASWVRGRAVWAWVLVTRDPAHRGVLWTSRRG